MGTVGDTATAGGQRQDLAIVPVGSGGGNTDSRGVAIQRDEHEWMRASLDSDPVGQSFSGHALLGALAARIRAPDGTALAESMEAEASAETEAADGAETEPETDPGPGSPPTDAADHAVAVARAEAAATAPPEPPVEAYAADPEAE